MGRNRLDFITQAADIDLEGRRGIRIIGAPYSLGQDTVRDDIVPVIH
jgi:hypothetical protein